MPALSVYKYEVSAGADGIGPTWSTYAALVAAPFGHIREDGFRLRTSAGYGEYRYTRPYFDPVQKRVVWLEFHGRQAFGDALIGYQTTIGPMVAKAFVGLSQEEHVLAAGAGSPISFDDENGVQGSRAGAKIVIETWTRLSDWGFLQADLNWSQPFEAYGARLRLGYLVGQGWSAGLETAAFGNLNHDSGRVGGFTRFEWSRGEISLSAGAEGDRHDIRSLYGSIGSVFRF